MSRSTQVCNSVFSACFCMKIGLPLAVFLALNFSKSLRLSRVCMSSLSTGGQCLSSGILGMSSAESQRSSEHHASVRTSHGCDPRRGISSYLFPLQVSQAGSWGFHISQEQGAKLLLNSSLVPLPQPGTGTASQ